MDCSVSVSNIEENSLFRKGDSASPLPSATPRELASGARRKIFIPKSKGDDADTTPPPDSLSPREEVPKRASRLSPETPSLSPSLSRRSPLLQPPSGQTTPFPAERRSPLPSRRKVVSDAPKQMQEPAQTDTAKPEEKPAEEDKHNKFKGETSVMLMQCQNDGLCCSVFRKWFPQMNQWEPLQHSFLWLSCSRKCHGEPLCILGLFALTLSRKGGQLLVRD